MPVFPDAVTYTEQICFLWLKGRN